MTKKSYGLQYILTRIFYVIIALFLLIVMLTSSIYIFDINQDNFINRNKLTNINNVTIYLEHRLPIGTTSAQDFVDFTTEQQLSCNPNPSFLLDSADVICDTPVTNPVFYRGRFLPIVLLDTVLDHILAEPPHLLITFQFVEGILQNIEIELLRGYI